MTRRNLYLPALRVAGRWVACPKCGEPVLSWPARREVCRSCETAALKLGKLRRLDALACLFGAAALLAAHL
jgi:hypothetical protein